MNFRIIFSLIVLTCFSISGVHAQKARLSRANKLYNQYAFAEAAVEYLKVVEKADIAEAKMNLADCYRRLGNSKDAEYWYGQMVRSNASNPDVMYYYAKALQENGKYSEAKEWASNYIEARPDSKQGQMLLKSCQDDIVSSLVNEEVRDLYRIENMPFNSPYDDFGPAVIGDKIIFSTERDVNPIGDRIFEWTGNPFLDLFEVKRELQSAEANTYSYSEETPYLKSVNTPWHDGPVSLTADKQTFYVTRNNLKGDSKRQYDDEHITRLKIYGTTGSDGAWGEFEGVPFNSDEYSVCHPALTPDGSKMYFASDMLGGFGGMDLWVTESEGGRWSPPVNMNSVIPGINTEGNDCFPHVAPDGTLYFSSTGHVGLGGYDIFSVRQNSNGQWGEITNLGAPVNSISDDLGIFIEENGFGYFSSDRAGGKGRDDIYSFYKDAITVQLLVVEENTGKPIANAEVVTECYGKKLTTDENGFVTLEIPRKDVCMFTASKDPFVPNSKTVRADAYRPGEVVEVALPLSLPKTYMLAGCVTNEVTGERIPNAKVKISTNCNNEVIELVADASGCWSQEVDAECNILVCANKDQYLQDCKNLRSEGDENSLNADLKLSPIPQTPKTTDFDPGKDIPTYPTAIVLEHIYYDFDKATIREDASYGLNRLLEILTSNPEINVEIASHTDSRGNDTYNQSLSERRAQSVVNWLVNKGIDPSRLSSRGYGESMLTNGCSNGVKCTEAEHQENRRTEFTVIGASRNGVAIPSQSVRPADIQIDRCYGCPW